jgi:uroporphyrinogen-III decarboxylase
VSCRLLETGSPEQIAAQVRKSIDDAGCDGGFILGSTHSLGPGVRYDNFMTMLETWHSFR